MVVNTYCTQASRNYNKSKHFLDNLGKAWCNEIIIKIILMLLCVLQPGKKVLVIYVKHHIILSAGSYYHIAWIFTVVI